MTDPQIELERRFGQLSTGPVRFLPGEELTSSRPWARLVERDHFAPVPPADFVARADQLKSPSCRLLSQAAAEVLMIAVHVCQRPGLQGSTELVDPEHVLRFHDNKVRSAELTFGDRIQIGRSQCRLERSKPGSSG